MSHHRFNYIELPATDLTAMKTFYGNTFGWTFKDWGAVSYTHLTLPTTPYV